MKVALHIALGLLLVGSQAHAASAAVDVSAFVRKEQFGLIELSPTGDYYAASVPMDDRTGIVIVRRVDDKRVVATEYGKGMHVESLTWVSPERLVVSMAEKFVGLEEPQPTGELLTFNVDGSRGRYLVGYKKGMVPAAGRLVDDLPADDHAVLVAVREYDPLVSVDRIDLRNGDRTTMAKAPILSASFATDHNGAVRFAAGAGEDNVHKLFYRSDNDARWELMNDEAVTGRIEVPLGFSQDGHTAYLQVEQKQGPDAIVALDLVSGSRTQVLRDDDSDPDQIVYKPGTAVPIGAMFMDGKPRMEFFDPASIDARLLRSLERALGGNVPRVTSSTKDGRLLLVATHSDRNPGDFYIFDTQRKVAELLLGRRTWLNAAEMAGMRPIAFTARDGLTINGYLTVPQAPAGKQLPMVLMPHGGPFGVRDRWGFDPEVQMLTAAGYAVLQVNFRGSAGYGRAFLRAGAREWGGAMQDDLTDATRWAIREGVADPARICIYGASYGGYAALMGVAKEPDLYKCAVGYAGVYDLVKMQKDAGWGDKQSARWTREWVGEPGQLEAVSPHRLARQIKVPVFLAAGSADETAPVRHTKKMESALRDAGVPVEAQYVLTEGHGFYTEANQRKFYARLLAFLNIHLGGAVAAAGDGSTSTAK